MKKQILLIAMGFFLSFGAVFAQAPNLFNYQGVARDASGQALANQAISLRLVIRQGSSTGTVLYTEDHAATTNAYGLYNVDVGDGTPVTNTFASINWENGDKYMQVRIDPNGGASYTDVGRTQLLSVPYSLSAANVEFEKSGSNFVVQKDIADKITIGSTTGQNLNKLHVTSSTGLSELVDFKATVLTSQSDVLNLEAPGSAPNDAQLIEASHGSNIKFKVDVSGDVTAEGAIRREQTGAANMVPIAYGYVNTSGAMTGAKTDNVSCTRTSSGSYEITITGESYFFSNYVTQATILSSGGGFITTSSVGGKLLVYTRNSSGTLTDNRFHFTVFKP